MYSNLTLYELFGEQKKITNSEIVSANQRMERWLQNAAAGNELLFSRRLKWDGIDEVMAHECLALISSPCKPSNAFYTSLASIFSKINDHKLRESIILNSKEKGLIKGVEILTENISNNAWMILEKTVDCHLIESLQMEAINDLIDLLTSRLTKLLIPVLQLQYQKYLLTKESKLTTKIKIITGSDDYCLEKFIHGLLDDKMASLMDEYPYLARLTNEIINEWQETIKIFLTRLKKDRRSMSSIFSCFRGSEKVISVKGNVSDLHNRGKSVLILTFEGGNRIIYKPQDVCSMHSFNKLLEWLSEEGLKPTLKSLKVLKRPGYGWIEYVVKRDCNDFLDLKDYFIRCGMLLFLCYILDGTDIHHENLIASGSDPVIIDMETIMHPRYPRRDPLGLDSAQNMAGNRIWKSVLRTMMLPNWMADYDGQRFNYSGVSMGNEDLAHSEKKVKNFPTMNGIVYSADQYQSEICLGFTRIANFFIKNKKRIISANGPLAKFKGNRVRFIFRPTSVYYQVINRLMSPYLLRDGIDASIEIDRLAITFLYNENKPDYWPMLKSEHKQLKTFNIPIFYTYTNKTTLYTDENIKIKNYFEASSLSEVLKNIERLTSDEISEQVQFIRNSFYSFKALPAHSIIQENTSHSLAKIENTLSFRNEDIITQAEVIADYISKIAIDANDGTSTWIAMQYIPFLNRYEYQVIDNSLYSGNIGISLFFASLYSLSGNQEYKKRCLSGMTAIRTRFQKDPSRYARVLGLGGYIGIPSISYGLFKSGLLLKNEEILDEARKTLELIHPDQIKNDKYLDVLLGTAGTLLVLLSIARETQSDVLTRLALVCGDHILNNIPNYFFHSSKIHKYDTRPRTGFSHGAAGIAWALMNLYSSTNDERYFQGACHLAQYENTYLNNAMNNWLDSDEEKTFYGRSWCHGSPGIALARLRMASVVNENIFSKDISCALNSEIFSLDSGVHNICCGVAGRSMILMEAYRTLKKIEYLEKAKKLTDSMLNSAHEQDGHYLLVPELPSTVNNPSLFQGLAGIGFALLSIIDSPTKNLPRLLSLE